MRELALFAGAGGGILGGLLLGWRTVCAVEIDPYCRSVLLARQRDGHIGEFPIWDDVRTFDGESWRGHVDVISGGFPCQDISAAGRGAGLAGARSGLWREFARIIGEVRPAHVFVENSPYLRTRGLVTVLQDLAGLGFDARWGVLGAENVRAPHPRKRMWIVADANRGRQRDVAELAEGNGRGSGRPRGLAPGVEGQQQFPFQSADANGDSLRDQPRWSSGPNGEEEAVTRLADWWPVGVIQGVDDGVAHRMDRVKATGNGQVSRVAALAWETLK